MDNKFFDFPETTKALAELSADIVKITSALKTENEKLVLKNNQCVDELTRKEENLLKLQQTSLGVIENIDIMITQLDKVLDKNGSSNNNN
ncbi:MAG: hypothetical protein E7012_06615 [Alphaproteobacteria bacterium]|nr:hypothetical protein [Alphaproteobacteria bacterium]